jgi:hypothetical protein
LSRLSGQAKYSTQEARYLDDDVDIYKTCVLCNLSKTLDDFHRAKRNKYGRRNYCKECDRKVRDKKIILPPRGEQTPYTKEQKKDWNLKRSYGITLDQFKAMSLSQQHKCAICLEEKKLYVDHDHSTGEVRALLCNTCNRALGFLHEDIDLMQRAIQYIRSF